MKLNQSITKVNRANKIAQTVNTVNTVKTARTPAPFRTRKTKLQHSLLRKMRHLRAALIDPTPSFDPTTVHDYEYFQTNDEPQITLSGFTLIILSPLLLCMHFKVASYYHIPPVQFLFTCSLIAFIYNLLSIVRTHSLYPYLPDKSNDDQLKTICLLNIVAIFLILSFGWNGSGGMLYAIVWEYLRGSKGLFYNIILGFIVVGSLVMEKEFTIFKLIQFLPGIIYGYICTTLFTLSKSSPFAIANELIYTMALAVPIAYFSTQVQTPNIKQLFVMLICGFSFLFTILMIIKTMQLQRVSIVMGISSGLISIATETFEGVTDYLAFLLIFLSLLVLLKLEYLG